MDDSHRSKPNVWIHTGFRGEHVTQFWPKHEKSIKRFSRLPWWLSGEEFTCQCRRHEFDLWSGKIPHAREHLNPCTTTLDPELESLGATATKPMRCSYWSLHTAEPALHKKSSHCSEKPAHRSEEWLPLSLTREESMQQRRPTTVKNKYINSFYFKERFSNEAISFLTKRKEG